MQEACVCGQAVYSTRGANGADRAAEALLSFCHDEIRNSETHNRCPCAHPNRPKADEVMGNTDDLGAGGMWAEVRAIETV